MITKNKFNSFDNINYILILLNSRNISIAFKVVLNNQLKYLKSKK